MHARMHVGTHANRHAYKNAVSNLLSYIVEPLLSGNIASAYAHIYTHTYIYIYISTPRNIARIQTRHVFNLFLSKCLFGSSPRLSIPIPSAATHGGANNGAHTVTLGHDRQSQDNIVGFAEGV